MKTFWTVIGKLALLAALIGGLTVLLTVIVLIATGDLDASQAQQNADSGKLASEPSYYAQIAGFIGGTLIMYLAFERKKKWPLGLGKQAKPFTGTGLGLLFGIAAMSLSFLGIWAFGGVGVEKVSFNGGIAEDMALYLLLFVLVALNEEYVCRGYIQGLLKHHYGRAAAIVVSSILFALLHSANPGMWDSPWPIVILVLAGVVLALSRELSGGLWVPMGFHLTWNFFQGNVYGFNVSGEQVKSVFTLHTKGAEWLAGGEFGAEGSVVTAVVLLACCLYGVYRLRGRGSHKVGNGAEALIRKTT